MKRLFIIPVLVILAGCGTLSRDDMGSTAGCLYDAETVRKVNEYMDETFPDSSNPLIRNAYSNRTAEVYQSQRNECMWAKAQAKKD